MQVGQTLTYAKYGIVIAQIWYILRFVYNRSRLLFTILSFLLLFSFLLAKFVKLQLLPISVFFIRNNIKGNYNEILCNKYCEIFKRLSFELNVEYDDYSRWNLRELRNLFNEVYTLYAALYISINVYKVVLPKRLVEFYKTLKLHLNLLTKARLPLTNLGHCPIVDIQIFDDVQWYVVKEISQDVRFNDFHTKTPVKAGTVSLLSALHRENSKYITDGMINDSLAKTEVLREIDDIIVLCNSLYNMMTIIKRDGLKEHSRSFLLQLFRDANFPFANTKFLKALSIFEFKGKHECIKVPRFIYTNDLIDALIVPNSKLVSREDMSRKPILNYSPYHKNNVQLISMLYGSNIYEKIVGYFDGKAASDPMVIFSNPNAASYELYVFSPSDIHFHCELGRNVFLYNYGSVGDSIGSVNVKTILNHGQFLVKYLMKTFGNDLKLVFHGISIGGLSTIKLSKFAEETFKNSEFVLCQKTFGDLPKLASHMVTSIFNPLLPLFGLDVSSVEDFLEIKTKKACIVDVNDEIIPLQCSLTACISDSVTIAGVHRASNLFIQFKLSSVKLMNSALSNSDIVTMQILKDIIKIVGNYINSTGQPLINLLYTDLDNHMSAKKDILRAMEFFTRFCIWGSLPIFCIPKKRPIEYFDLSHFYNICSGSHSSKFAVFNGSSVLVSSKVAALFCIFLNSNVVDWIVDPEKSKKASISDSNRAISLVNAKELKVLHSASTGLYFINHEAASIVKKEHVHVASAIKSDLSSFGVDTTINSIRHFVWMRLYSILGLLKCLDMIENVSFSSFNSLDLSEILTPKSTETESIDVVRIAKQASGTESGLASGTESGLASENSNGAIDFAGVKDILQHARQFIGALIDIVIDETTHKTIKKLPSDLVPVNVAQDDKLAKHIKEIIGDAKKFGNVIPAFSGHNISNSKEDLKLIAGLQS
ncbi:conserved hypothetical protein [Theileria equi strain WA]|uniref:Uncharacterized protein n=1 Tax=Theileria equi strain WA TaxID=1537102 RepID=L1LC92_THEEQ|nr:conserved hypothetical protein [Theileria equi strain WA]EKX72870.1 conserved hypothetical protein [Theileria equi strain WA]|eukprot:XP_004832322.1 conserved hypothetical protein [Theileria equi strain WA]